MPESAWALDAGGRRGKMDGQMSLDRFQARCKWEMSASVSDGVENVSRSYRRWIVTMAIMALSAAMPPAAGLTSGDVQCDQVPHET